MFHLWPDSKRIDHHFFLSLKSHIFDSNGVLNIWFGRRGSFNEPFSMNLALHRSLSCTGMWSSCPCGVCLSHKCVKTSPTHTPSSFPPHKGGKSSMSSVKSDAFVKFNVRSVICVVSSCLFSPFAPLWARRRKLYWALAPCSSASQFHWHWHWYCKQTYSFPSCLSTGSRARQVLEPWNNRKVSFKSAYK